MADDEAAYLYQSVDFGRTWQDIASGLPGGAVNVIREDPKNESMLYAGTDLGVYVSIDGGKNWNVLGGNLPRVYALDLVVHPRDPVVVIATHGRGMFAIDISSIQKPQREFEGIKVGPFLSFVEVAISGTASHSVMIDRTRRRRLEKDVPGPPKVPGREKQRRKERYHASSNHRLAHRPGLPVDLLHSRPFLRQARR
jgi:hypothetical protein